MTACMVDGCSNPAKCRGLCGTHYTRLYRHGDPLKVRRRDHDRKRMRDVWSGMIKRCYNPKSPSYPYYGAKGITVCDRWRNSFDAFLADVGTIPRGLTIDRIDNSRGYFPDNVRVASVTEQNRNKGDTRNLLHNGRRQTLSAWAAEAGMSKQRLAYRPVCAVLLAVLAVAERARRDNPSW